ncbi:Ivy family c-type lysozyme inhibitor [Methyloceanibacter stevinii]|nr:Ivy family c-type lysozyme inhibitor [Methyloceanibacter stevinii]
MLARFLLTLLLFGATPAMAQAPEGPYLPDLMKEQPAYLTAWKEMVAGEKLPAWVDTFTKTQGAVATPVKTIPVAGQPHTLGWICKPHDCGGNEVYVLFAPEARQAWGLMISDDKRRWLGNPDAAVQAAIESGVQ